MTRSNNRLIQQLTTTVLCTAFAAASLASANPYATISERNIFGLQPPPPPEPVDDGKDEEPEEPPADVKATGIMTISGVPRALIKLKIQGDPKAKKPAEERGYVMIAGDPPIDGVQVLEIQDAPDIKDVKVKVRQGEKEFWLALEKDTPKGPPAGAPGAAPGGAQVAAAKPGTPANRVIAGQQRTPTLARNNPGLQNTSMPTRPLRTPSPGSPQLGTAGVNSSQPVQQGYQIREGGLFRRDYGISAEEQDFLINAGEQVNQETGIDSGGPPSPWNSDINVGFDDQQF